MSIRTKLGISHSLMMLVPVLVTVILAYALFHVFAGQWNAVKAQYRLDGYSLGDFMHGEMMAVAELQSIMRDHPDLLLDEARLHEYGDRLAGRNIGIALFRSGELRYASEGLGNRVTGWLPVRPPAPGETYAWREESLHLHGRWFAGIQYMFRFADGSDGNLFLLLDGSPVDRLIHHLLPWLLFSLPAALIAANVLLTGWLSRRLIRPILELRQATERIREGDLDQVVVAQGRDELGDLGRAFEEMRQRLHESVRERLRFEENRKQLIANISHDLKTPITAIMGYAQGMLDGVAATPERLAKYARTIHAHASDLARLVDELLLYSKLDLNRVPFRFTELDLGEYAGRIVEEYRLYMESRGIRLDAELPAEPVRVTADPEQLKRVFTNLLENSAKHMDKEDGRILLRVMRDGEAGFARVEIADNGEGIDGRDLPHIFDRFYRAEASRSGGGSGLGLAIAAQIVEAHGGKIRADSEWGKGTIVTFTLKLSDRTDRAETNMRGGGHETRAHH
ncbi:MAG: hypothetical protein A9Z00_13180 [Thermobacillus sp. ZCTH02-B1]|uniref:sensor histidine kinase n=1 Tax=Thermobacillus sp. ZCTH02-B1 TaxID=1858795 RepID=UPI000B549922|nr:HAMP domain-containing sensor histidine kinase [Thermobacillus sp. ZCTH02-B1]OUM97369.1 MAG: hypothetical protein A9Z00_13180 [Thermobacillus sp. ZCTH02-B1]